MRGLKKERGDARAGSGSDRALAVTNNPYLVFGGGNSETGFNDVAELAFDGKASWRKCAPARGACTLL